MSGRIIKILDTTLRDGEQTSGISFTEEEKLLIAKALLLDLNIDAVEVASARVSEGEFKAAKHICRWAEDHNMLDRIEMLGFVDYNKSADWILQTGCKTMNLLCKGSLNHLTNQLNKTPEDHIKDINKTVQYAHKAGIKVNIYLEDFSNGIAADTDYIFYLIDNIKGVNRIMLPDTLGILNPDSTFEYCSILVKKYPDLKFDFHAHNDYGLAEANLLACVNAGISRVHTTINGLGERAGNCSFASAVAVIHDHSEFKTMVVENKTKDISSLIESFSGIRVAQNTPVVGENVFTQTCGVHADGDKKGNLYFNKLLPERFGGQRNYALGKTSGKASIQKNLEKLGIELDEEAQKKVLQKVIEFGDKKEKVTLADLPYIIADVLGTPINTRVKLIDFSLVLKLNLKPSAMVKLEIDGVQIEANATGDGQYDAFMKAVSSIFTVRKETIPELVDYSVTIPPGGRTDALVETIITWKDKTSFKTRGVDCDQASAAIEATINMLNQWLQH
ncbi:MAG: 2-isopropylmalate synthase [bacterium]|nr:2-isopropylmalate synthase [bacterium]